MTTPADPQWLTPPYYILPTKEFVDCGVFFGKQPTAQARMEDLTNQILGWPPGFMFGAAGSGADTPEKLLAEITSFAQDLTNAPFAKLTAAGFDPNGSAQACYDLVIATLKRIQASHWDWTETRSVYEVWIAKVGS